MTLGTILAIERGSIHDGPGIRTTVFLKGCPLTCLWCHNPESQSIKSVIFKIIDKCQHCGRCIEQCPNGCQTLEGIDRSKCTTCGKCVKICNSDALDIKGHCMSAEDVMNIVIKDKAYYKTSGGGMTLSGGEPLQQWKFSALLLQKAQQNGIHTCVETCGYGKTEHLIEISKYTDLFYYDIKASKEQHKELTGVENDLILDNLEELDKVNANVVLRCPLVPNVNDGQKHLLNIAALAGKYDCVKEVDPLPYHPLAESKRRSIGLDKSDMPEEFVTKEQYQDWITILSGNTSKPIVETDV
ncbi:MAG: glycyl-radical enzyme activating protein [Kiritimatiellae bacterium]|jgi:glycyl-radical enzyme activating protein|nr:glycyl-radical enzyme activating protein [Kiritimatiellia bacterium]